MKKLFAPVLGLFAAAVLLIEPAAAQLILDADNPSNVQSGTFWSGSLRDAILTIINFFLFFLGIIATAFVIYGGFLYVTSQGDDQAVEKAKKIITFAAIGIVIILISFALINTLLGGLQSGQRV